MADFTIQRGTKALTDAGNTQGTITAGTDYTAPTGPAFIILTSIQNIGVSSTGSSPRYSTIYINNPNNLATSILFSRQLADGVATVKWEIIEYSGPAGGANEFKVRKAEAVAYTANSNTKQGGAMDTSVVTDADICVFITGQRTAGTGVDPRDHLSTAAWNTGAQKVDLTRIRAGDTSATLVSYAVVEFTGSNWTVQRVAHAYSAAATDETETINAVTMAQTFIHIQSLPGTWTKDFDTGQEIWLSSTTAVTFRLDSQANVSTKSGVVWVVSNSQSTGTIATCQRFSGTETGATTVNQTLSPAVILAEASVMGLTSRNARNGIYDGATALNGRLTTTTNLELTNPYASGYQQNYRVEVFGWPTAAASGGPSLQHSQRGMSGGFAQLHGGINA